MSCIHTALLLNKASTKKMVIALDNGDSSERRDPPSRSSPFEKVSNKHFYVLGAIVFCYFQLNTPLTSQVIVNNYAESDGPDALLHKRFDTYYRDYRYVEPAERRFSQVPLPQCGVRPDFVKWFDQKMEERSRLSEDQIIYKTFFKDSPKKLLAHGTTKGIGTYIELGAFDGVTESNSRFFDACLGWDGLLIEGNPLVYLQTIGTRPFSHRISYAPSCKEANSTVRFHTVEWTNGGLEGSAKTYDGKKVPHVDVPCGPLAPVIEDVFRSTAGIVTGGSNGNVTKFGATKPTVNFFSLDVEGAELLVLDTIDFQAVHIDILMSENTNADCKANDICEVREKVRAKMKAEGYTLYDDMVRFSDVFVHPQSPFQPSEYNKVGAPKSATTANHSATTADDDNSDSKFSTA